MTILSDEPTVEPLSEASWKRIEHGIFAELAHDREAFAEPGARSAWWARGAWRPAWVLGACAAAALVAVMFWQGRDNDDSAVAPEPSRIVTADSPARLTVGRATITVAPASALWIRSAEGSGVQVMLEAGRVDCAVAPRSDRAPFVVQAGDVRVEVVGTRFAVERRGAAVSVAVKKGVVAVFHDGERIELVAGQSWPQGASRPPGTAPAPTSASKAASRAAEDRAAAGASQAGNAAASPNHGKQAQPATESPATASRALYEQAAGLEASAPHKARAIYRSLAEQSGPWAANALYAQARLEHDLGKRERARTLLRSYLQRFPQGANAADARALLARP